MPQCRGDQRQARKFTAASSSAKLTTVMEGTLPARRVFDVSVLEGSDTSSVSDTIEHYHEYSSVAAPVFPLANCKELSA